MSDRRARQDGFIVTYRDGELHGMRIEKGDKIANVLKTAKMALDFDPDALGAIESGSVMERAAKRIADAVLKIRGVRRNDECRARRSLPPAGYGRIW